MIYFNEYLVAKTINTINSVKDSFDMSDVLNDINRIQLAIESINQNRHFSEAEKLDIELRQKYPYIEIMLNVANSISVPSLRNGRVHTEFEILLSRLKQDYYGILCDTAIKKGIINDVRKFIDHTDQLDLNY